MAREPHQLHFRHRWMRKLVNLYPPYVGAAIRVRRTESGGYLARMKLTWYNRNLFGTHFGGSLYAMCDPFYSLILLEELGRDFIVWDKAATIDFRRPGKGTVSAHFEISPDRVEEIRQTTLRDGKTEPRFSAEIVDGDGEVVAVVEKVIYVRAKNRTEPSTTEGTRSRG